MKTATTKRMRKLLSIMMVMLLALAPTALLSFAADAYAATFTITGGTGSIVVFDGQDYTAAGTVSNTAVSDNNAQINFKVVPESGYAVESVSVTGSYKNLKDSSETGAENVYRITKIASDLTVAVTLTASTEVDTSDPVITFTDSTATLTSGSATGVSISGTAVKITAAGTYTFTGSCASGTIVVKKNVTGVMLILDGLTLTAHATAPITCNKGSGVTIVAAAGSVNTLTDDKYNNDDTYTDTTAYPDIENAVIKCKDGSNVILDGTGTINVNAYGKNGVKGGGDLYEEDADGNYTSTLLSTASLTIQNLTLNINATVNDGLKSDKELNILSGNITVSAADDGIKSDYTLNIGATGTTGPTIKVTKAKEGIEGATINVYSGNISVSATDDGINAANSDIAERSTAFTYNQYGGYVYVNCTNGDGLDSNGSATFAGGVMEVYSPSQGDGDPIDTEYGATFSGGTVLGVGNNMMQQAYSGTYVTFGSSSQQGGPGGFGGMYAPGMGGNSSGSTVVSAGSTISIKDSSGNVIYTAQSTAPRAAGYVVFASASLSSSGSYTLAAGASSSSGSSTTGSGSTGSQPGGQPGGGAWTGGGSSSGSSSSGFSFSFFSDFIQKIIDFFTSLFSFNLG